MKIRHPQPFFAPNSRRREACGKSLRLPAIVGRFVENLSDFLQSSGGLRKIFPTSCNCREACGKSFRPPAIVGRFAENPSGFLQSAGGLRKSPPLLKTGSYKSRNHFFPDFVRNQSKKPMQTMQINEYSAINSSISLYLLFYNP